MTKGISDKKESKQTQITVEDLERVEISPDDCSHGNHLHIFFPLSFPFILYSNLFQIFLHMYKVNIIYL